VQVQPNNSLMVHQMAAMRLVKGSKLRRSVTVEHACTVMIAPLRLQQISTNRCCAQHNDKLSVSACPALPPATSCNNVPAFL